MAGNQRLEAFANEQLSLSSAFGKSPLVSSYRSTKCPLTVEIALLLAHTGAL